MDIKIIKDLIEIIYQEIKSEQETGNHAGGSGHMGFISYKLDSFKIESLKTLGKKITYWFTRYIETEFTMIPDNLPYEYICCRTIHLNAQNSVQKTSNCDENSALSNEWVETQKQVSELLKNRINSELENNSAPYYIKSPPLFIESALNGSTQYICLLEVNSSQNQEDILIQADTPQKLIVQVETFIEKVV